jgi:hypothetical protein
MEYVDLNPKLSKKRYLEKSSSKYSERTIACSETNDTPAKSP